MRQIDGENTPIANMQFPIIYFRTNPDEARSEITRYDTTAIKVWEEYPSADITHITL